METENLQALDAFIDDCLLGEDSLCKYDHADLDLVASRIIQGILSIKSQTDKAIR